MKTTNKYYMSFEEAQEYVSKRGLDVPWNDCDVFIGERGNSYGRRNII